MAARDGGDLLEPRPLLEADDSEVRLVDAQDDGGLRSDRALEVGGARPVRRADLHEPRTGAREHVRNAETVADLDQLAARDDDVPALRQRGEGEEHCGGVVVDNERGFRARQPAQDRRDVILARAPRALRQVELEVRVAPRGIGDPLDGLLGQRRATEVGMDNHSRRVEHAPQARPSRVGQLLPQAHCEISRIRPSPDLLPRPVDHRPGGVHRERVAGLARELVHRGQIAQLHCANATARRPCVAHADFPLRHRRGRRRARSRARRAGRPSG